MNPGGIRADLQTTDGSVTYGAAFAVQPFNNYDVSMDLTGAQILDAARPAVDRRERRHQPEDPAGLRDHVLLRPVAAAVDTDACVGDVKVTTTARHSDGAADDPTTYRVVANTFLSDGGDGFAAFKASEQAASAGSTSTRSPRSWPRTTRTPVPATDRHRPSPPTLRRRWRTCRRSGRRRRRRAGRPRSSAGEVLGGERDVGGADVLLEVAAPAWCPGSGRRRRPGRAPRRARAGRACSPCSSASSRDLARRARGWRRGPRPGTAGSTTSARKSLAVERRRRAVIVPVSSPRPSGE